MASFWQILLLLWQSHLLAAQGFVDEPTSYSGAGFSNSCRAALETNLTSCHPVLGDNATPNIGPELLPLEGLQALCVDSCRAELVSVRSTIAASCKASTDVFIYQGVKYPATLRVELMLNAFDVSCYKEKSTGTLCDLVLAEMRNGSRPVNGCSDCLLGPARLQLSSPVGYDADTAQEFSSATVNCSASGYSYTTPPPFAISSTSTTPSPPQQTCAGSTKAVSTGDTCFSIAEANGVSTYGLITANNLDIYCSRLPSTVCLPPTCQTYEWKPYDTCEDVVAQAGITLAQFLAWNPLFDSTCSNAQRWRGWTVCIGAPGGSSPPPPVISAVPVPPNAMLNSNKSCAAWHNVTEGDNCYNILSTGGSVTFAQFRILNPDVDANCTNLWLGYSYCVIPLSPIEVPATKTFTRPPTATSTPINFTPVTPTIHPRASNTETNCTQYRNAEALFNDSTGSLFNINLPPGADAINACWFVAASYGISVEALRAWNPSLPGEGQNCTLQAGKSYCVAGGSAIPPPAVTPTATGSPATSSTPSSSTRTSSSSPSTPTKVISTDGTCGNGVTCLDSRFGNCCSSAGYCGGTTPYCGNGCQREWGGCDNPWLPGGQIISTDGTCGGNITCLFSGFGDCCSAYGYCGWSSDHCGAGCQNKLGHCDDDGGLIVSLDGTCGNGVTCQGSEFGDCCSEYGYCGSEAVYCGVGCQVEFGTCS